MRTRLNGRISATTLGAICAILLSFAPLQASTLTQTAHFPAPGVEYQGNFCLVTLAGTPSLANPGEPLLPVHSLQILLPQGEEVSGVVANISQIQGMRIDAPLACGQSQARLSRTGPVRATLPDETIYAGSGQFPASRAVHVTTQTYRGYNIAFINVYPVT